MLGVALMTGTTSEISPRRLVYLENASSGATVTHSAAHTALSTQPSTKLKLNRPTNRPSEHCLAGLVACSGKLAVFLSGRLRISGVTDAIQHILIVRPEGNGCDVRF